MDGIGRRLHECGFWLASHSRYLKIQHCVIQTLGRHNKSVMDTSHDPVLLFLLSFLLLPSSVSISGAILSPQASPEPQSKLGERTRDISMLGELLVLVIPLPTHSPFSPPSLAPPRLPRDVQGVLQTRARAPLQPSPPLLQQVQPFVHSAAQQSQPANRKQKTNFVHFPFFAYSFSKLR